MALVTQQLPLSDLPFYEYSAGLEGQSRILTFAYNETEGAWYLTVANEEDQIIFEGRKLVANYPLTLDYSLEEYNMTGTFYLLPKSDDEIIESSTQQSLATYYNLYYMYIEEE